MKHYPEKEKKQKETVHVERAKRLFLQRKQISVYPLPSRIFETAVNELAKLPGIGRKTAMRMALYLLKSPREEAEAFGMAIIRMHNDIRYCKECGNISDEELCSICGNPKRDRALVCVVEDVRDVMAIENTGQFTGIYHVLGGIISPMEGIGPGDLNIQGLVDKVITGSVSEVILALPTTIEGDTTNFYIYKKLQSSPVPITAIARGISVGDELEHTDEITLGRSIVNRTPYESTLQKKK
jgi:recombination protein RecR